MHRVAEYGVAAHWQYKSQKRDRQDDRAGRFLTQPLPVGRYAIHVRLAGFLPAYEESLRRRLAPAP